MRFYLRMLYEDVRLVGYASETRIFRMCRLWACCCICRVKSDPRLRDRYVSRMSLTIINLFSSFGVIGLPFLLFQAVVEDGDALRPSRPLQEVTCHEEEELIEEDTEEEEPLSTALIDKEGGRWLTRTRRRRRERVRGKVEEDRAFEDTRLLPV